MTPAVIAAAARDTKPRHPGGAAGEPRVVLVSPSLARLGSDFGAIPRALAGAGVRSAVYAPAPEPGTGWDGPEAVERFGAGFPPGTQMHTLRLRRQRLGPAGLLATARQAFGMGRRHPDAVFLLFNLLSVVLCGPPLRLRGRRCVFVVTGLGSSFAGGTARRRMVARVLLRLFRVLFSGPRSRVIVHNHEDRTFLAERLRLDPARITVTPGCGIDPAEFPRLPPAPPAQRKVIYAPLRLLREKGVLDAVEASRILLSRGVEHEMWFSCTVDPGNPSSLGEAEVRAIEAANPSVRFLGWHPSTVPLYQAAHVVCVPTRYREGLPTVLLEAAACGRPIVATDNVGCRDFVEDGRTGVMVPPGSPVALADALARVLADEPLARRLAEEAHQHFLAGFTKDEMVRRTFGVLRQLGLALPATGEDA